MKNLLLVFLFVIFISGGVFYSIDGFNRNNTGLKTPSPTVPSVVLPSQKPHQRDKTFLFVPYWTVGEKTQNTSLYDEVGYFGITVTTQGIDVNEDGYKKMNVFLSQFGKSKKKFVVVRMINGDVNARIIKDKSLQKKIIEEIADVTHEYSFDGVVLDLEYSALPLQSIVTSISNFYELFYTTMKKNSVPFYTTLYGDVFYRARPYDVKKIAENSDQVLVMAYDFHKANGTPGPNFPLNGREIYGYDFAKMIDDYLSVVPSKKLTVVFGLFGYDWIVDKENRSLKSAESLSLNAMNKKFFPDCDFSSCKIAHDDSSSEIKIEYIDSDGKQHVVWFEDMDSVAKKQQYLLKKGIGSTGFWAYSYF